MTNYILSVKDKDTLLEYIRDVLKCALVQEDLEFERDSLANTLNLIEKVVAR